jgi:formate dehydrogenase subunit delta
MQIDTLVHMTNQIGQFFEAMPDRDEAMEGIAQHLRRFWEPRMRRELLAHVDAGGVGLSALVLDAIALNRVMLEPAPQSPPSAKASASSV